MNKRHLAIIITGVLYGLIGIFVKLIGSSMPMMSMSFFRVLFGFLFVAGMMPFLKGSLKLERKDLKHFIAIGFLMALTFTIYNIAFLYAPIGNVALLVNCYVIFTAILAYLFLKEKLMKRDLFLMMCGLIGIAIMSPLSPGAMIGNLLGIASGIAYAMLLVYMRYVERHHTVAAVFWFLLFATIMMLPFPFIEGVAGLWGNLLWLVLLGALPTGLAYVLLAYGLEKTDAETSSILIVLVTPLSSIMFAWIVFREVLMASIFFGGIILLFAGVLLENEKMGKKKRK